MNKRRLLPIDADRVEDMDLIIHWKLRHQMAFVFEIELDVVQPLLPPGLHATEARPGVGLIFVGYNDYDLRGNFIGGEEQPSFHEMTRCVLVHPDLSVRMPVPRFTFFVLRIGSENRAFVDQEIAELHLPSYHSPSLRAETNAAGTELHLGDDAGLIQHLRSTHPAHTYRNEAFFGQYYTEEEGRLYFGVWSWRGVSCVHQRPGDAGGISDHPFLSERQPTFPAAKVGMSYQQVVTRPGEISEQRFYRPRLVRDRGVRS